MALAGGLQVGVCASPLQSVERSAWDEAGSGGAALIPLAVVVAIYVVVKLRRRGKDHRFRE